MYRLSLSPEALQSLHTARRTTETRIRETKALIRQPHVPGGSQGEAQSSLHTLKWEATLLYGTLALTHGRNHCPTWPQYLVRLRDRSPRYCSDLEKQVLGLQQVSEPLSAAV